MITDSNTGEVRPAAVAWADLRARAERHRLTNPDTPPEIDQELREIEALGFDLADFQAQLATDLDEAKRVLNARLSVLSAKYELKGRTQTMVNRLAEAEAAVEVSEVARLTVIVDHARRIARALSSKHIGLQNTNKGLQPLAAAAHRRSP
ncbi:hypothetical protein [Microbacterium sp. MMO-10]|uniref:hypothetical protein n=1 Tax=Microbacterium sp. MMO-10 TaxID=3081272 RepID=UPI003018901F